MSESGFLGHDRSEMNVIFIHSELDDYGLTAAEFRVYAHLSRRAGKDGAYPGIDSMSKICCLSKQTVITAIRRLEEIGMLSVRRKDGERNRYRLTKPSLWTINRRSSENTGLNEGTAATGLDEGTGETNLGNGTGLNEGTKGNPVKGNPKRKSTKAQGAFFTILSETLPPPLNTPEIQDAWDIWQEHRRQIKEPLTEETARAQIKKMMEWGPQRALEALQFTVFKGWRGLAEPNNKQRSEMKLLPATDWKKITAENAV